MRLEFHATNFKINAHILGHEIEPKAKYVQTGSADFCRELAIPIQAVLKKTQSEGLIPESDVVLRHGIHGEMHSVYFRDPDGNLLEFSSYE